MSENTTIYTVTGAVQERPSGTLAVSVESSATNPLLAPYSSSLHETSRLNAIVSGTEFFEPSGTWASFIDGETLQKPRASANIFYSKPSFVSVTGNQDPRFVQLIYAVTASSATGSIWIGTANEGSKVTGSIIGAAISATDTNEYREIDGYVVGRYVAQEGWDPYTIRFPVNERGRIRDIKVWLEFLHDSRTQAPGLDGLTIALKSPNIRFDAANALLNSSETGPIVANPNPNLSGANGIVEDEYGKLGGIQTIRRGTYLLWDGHLANVALSYLTSSNAAGLDMHEFGNDIDMRVVFSDSSQNINPASRLAVFPSATLTEPGASTNLLSTLISSSAGYRPLGRYYAPNNYAKRNYPNSVVSATLEGSHIPWAYPSRLVQIENDGLLSGAINSSGGFNGAAFGYPPPGWNTGAPNGGLSSSDWTLLAALGGDALTQMKDFAADVSPSGADNFGNPIVFLAGGFAETTISGVFSVPGEFDNFRVYGSALYTNNKFIVVGMNDPVSFTRGIAATSSDMYNWSGSLIGTPNLTMIPHDMAVSGTKIVAVGLTASAGLASGKSAISTDGGSTWTTGTIGPAGNGHRARAVAFGETAPFPTGVFYTVGSEAFIASSTDGQVWATQTLAFGSFKDITYVPNRLSMFAVGGGFGDKFVLVSSTLAAETITTGTLPNNFFAQKVIVSGTSVIVFGFPNNTASLAISNQNDLVNWQTGTIYPGVLIQDATLLGNKIVVVGELEPETNGFTAVSDGVSLLAQSTWTPSILEGTHTNSIVNSGSFSVVFSNIVYGSVAAKSQDGVSWDGVYPNFSQTLLRRYGVRAGTLTASNLEIYRYKAGNEEGSRTGSIPGHPPRTSGTGFFTIDLVPHSTSFYAIVGGGHSSSLVIGRSSSSAGQLMDVNWDTSWKTGTDFGLDDSTQGIVRSSAFARVYNAARNKCLIYSIGGRDNSNVSYDTVQFFSATTVAPYLTLSLGPWSSVDSGSNVRSNATSILSYPTTTYTGFNAQGIAGVAVSGNRISFFGNWDGGGVVVSSSDQARASWSGTRVMNDDWGPNWYLDGFRYLSGNVNRYVIVGTSGTLGAVPVIATSTDGVVWSTRTSPSGTLYHAALAHNGTNKIVAIGYLNSANSSLYVISSSDGDQWGKNPVNTNLLRPFSLIYGDKFVGVCQDLSLAIGHPDRFASVITSSDQGETWGKRGVGSQTGLIAGDSIQTITWNPNNSKYFASSLYDILSSSNGWDWGLAVRHNHGETKTSNIVALPALNAVAVSYPQTLRTPSKTLISFDNGSTWNTFTSPKSQWVLAASGSKLVGIDFYQNSLTASLFDLGASLFVPALAGRSLTEAAAAVDEKRATLYYGGGLIPRDARTGTLVDNAKSISTIWGHSYQSSSGLLTGTSFIAGEIPVPLSRHTMYVYDDILYVVGGGDFTYLSGGATNAVINDKIYAGFINSNGAITDWVVVSNLPGSKLKPTGSGMAGGASLMFSTSSGDAIFVLGGERGTVRSTSSDNVFSTKQSYFARINYVGGGAKNIAATRLGDGVWMGPAAGELQTYGEQFGASDIRPVFPLLDDIEETNMKATVSPDRAYVDLSRRFTGLRPGLKGSEINGVWELQIGLQPDFNAVPIAGEKLGFHVPPLGAIWVRQARLEFLVDKSSFGEIETFNPGRRFMYQKPSTSAARSRRLVDIVSGSTFWDAGVHYIFSRDRHEYGRKAGISTDMDDVDVAVSVDITGALWDYLSGSVSGTPSWFLNPPPGEGVPGLPYIPVSSASFGEASRPPSATGSGEDMLLATIDQRLPVPIDNTIQAYLSRLGVVKTTQQLYEEELARTRTGSVS